ncbi:uncharacterized protein RJT21DRAFT_48722 [Scheffersomyces amazonensis]|uniref:uncharacterized protein n=1 Tax=Scheffersomyces amazonensis TaxID=1078765 RepID=UPI00315CEA69
MKLFNIIISLFCYFIIVQGLADQDMDPETTSGPPPPTTVWITVTTNGHPVTIQSLYSQEFMKTYTEAETTGVESGVAGLGSLSGSVGGLRTYEQSTVGGGSPERFNSITAIYSSIVGVILLFFGLI